MLSIVNDISSVNNETSMGIRQSLDLSVRSSKVLRGVRFTCVFIMVSVSVF